MFGGIVGVAYAMFYFSFALMLQFFAAPLVAAASAEESATRSARTC